MPFAEESYSRTDTRKRTSASYVKWSTDYRIVLRILNPNAKLVWKHWISEANGGRGMMANCPNTGSQIRPCPIDKQIVGLDKTDPTYMERKSKKRFMVNVLDRTPVTVCNSCSNTTFGKKCQFCGADLRKAEFVPLNRVKILEGGPQLFSTTLNAVEDMQREDFDVDITAYDINFTATGEGRDRKIAAIPQPPSELPEEAFLDPETNEPQKLFDLDLLSEPNSVEEVELMLQGATLDEINAVREPVAATAF